ncbi:putative holin-like toxin [Paenibacillus sp. p3-SID1389]
MPVEVKDALTIMIGFSSLIIALLTLIVTIVLAILNQKK